MFWISESAVHLLPSPMRTFVHWHTCSTDWLYHMLHTIAKESNNYAALEFVAIGASVYHQFIQSRGSASYQHL